jgi:hypothetical protein
MSQEEEPEAADAAQTGPVGQAKGKDPAEQERSGRERAEREGFQGTSASHVLQGAARRRREAEEKLQKHQEEAKKHAAKERQEQADGADTAGVEAGAPTPEPGREPETEP